MPDHPTPNRAELEARFVEELTAIGRHAGIDPATLREVAVEAVTLATREASEHIGVTVVQAFERLLWMERQSVHELMRERKVEPATAEAREAMRAGEMWTRGCSLIKAGRMDEAKPAFEDARRRFVLVRDDYGQAQCDYYLGVIHLRRNDGPSAERHLTLAVDGHRRMGDQFMAGAALEALGNLARNRGDREDARFKWMRALVLYTNVRKRQEPEGRRVMEALAKLD